MTGERREPPRLRHWLGVGRRSLVHPQRPLTEPPRSVQARWKSAIRSSAVEPETPRRGEESSRITGLTENRRMPVAPLVLSEPDNRLCGKSATAAHSRGSFFYAWRAHPEKQSGARRRRF